MQGIVRRVIFPLLCGGHLLVNLFVQKGERAGSPVGLVGNIVNLEKAGCKFDCLSGMKNFEVCRGQRLVRELFTSWSARDWDGWSLLAIQAIIPGMENTAGGNVGLETNREARV